MISKNDEIIVIKTSAGYIRTFDHDNARNMITAQFTDNIISAKQNWSMTEIDDVHHFFVESKTFRLNAI